MTMELWDRDQLSDSGEYVAVPLDLVRATGDWLTAGILQEVHYWTRYNSRRPDRKRTHFQHGRWWMRRNQGEWAARLAVSPRTADRRLTALGEEGGYLLRGNFNRHKYDRTLWYAVAYDRVAHALAQVQPVKSVEEESQRDPYDFGPFTVARPKRPTRSRD